MKCFNWNSEKNNQLLKDRNIGFEDVIVAIDSGKILDVVKHPNKEQYPNQKIFVVEIDNYAYLVPFVENKDEVFLKTIFASRKATRDYLGGNDA